MGLLDHSEDERQVWRSDPVTKSLVESLKAAKEGSTRAMTSMLSEGSTEAAVAQAGWVNALEWVISTVEKQ